MNEVHSMTAASTGRPGSGAIEPLFGDLATFTPGAEDLDRSAIVAFDGRDSRSRPFNILRTQVAKRLVHSNARVVGITSATPNAGKSFLALNLAAALSRMAEQQVFLLDLDLRRASLATGLGMDIESGISDYLDGSVDDLKSIGRRLEGSNLAVFPTCPISGHSAELLAGERFVQLIESFRCTGSKAIVLCDMPPAFANDDTMIAMQQLDGFIMVVDSGNTTRRQVQDTLEMLQPSPCIGAVLNRYNGGIMEMYGYGFGYGSKAYDGYYS
jgi:Mrp family chromosome partitioning ATPase